jgi:predicted Zn-ribbon and HTH transcriptional regulator
MRTPCKCPKCSAEMEEGFILEHRQPVRWIAGKAETSISGDVKSSGEQRRIESYRCIGCGYLESYARTTVR